MNWRSGDCSVSFCHPSLFPRSRCNRSDHLGRQTVSCMENSREGTGAERGKRLLRAKEESQPPSYPQFPDCVSRPPSWGLLTLKALESGTGDSRHMQGGNGHKALVLLCREELGHNPHQGLWGWLSAVSPGTVQSLLRQTNTHLPYQLWLMSQLCSPATGTSQGSPSPGSLS